MPTKNHEVTEIFVQGIDGDVHPLKIAELVLDVTDDDAECYEGHSIETITVSARIDFRKNLLRKALRHAGFRWTEVWFPKKHRYMRSLRRMEKRLRAKDKMKQNNNSKEK